MSNDTPAHWQGEITRLAGHLEQAEAALEEAKGRAALALLDGGEDTSREITVARDRIDATRAAWAEAQRRLSAAEKAVTKERQAAEIKKAREAAKARHKAAQEFDVAMKNAEAALLAFLGAGERYRIHILNAGQKALSFEKMLSGEALRGSSWLAAPVLSKTLHVPRAVQSARTSLAGWSAIQTPWKDTH